MEPIQDLIRIYLEVEGYFVRSNVRYLVSGKRKDGKKTGGYSDLDIIAIKIDSISGKVIDKIWGEVKAHLTSTLNATYINGFTSDYATMLNLDKFKSDKKFKNYSNRQQHAIRTVNGLLGPDYRRILYFGGMKSVKGEKSAVALLDPDLKICYIKDLIKTILKNTGHMEGDEPLVRLINTLKKYGHLK